MDADQDRHQEEWIHGHHLAGECAVSGAEAFRYAGSTPAPSMVARFAASLTMGSMWPAVEVRRVVTPGPWPEVRHAPCTTTPTLTAPVRNLRP